jgi:hypothetical protein
MSGFKLQNFALCTEDKNSEISLKVGSLLPDYTASYFKDNLILSKRGIILKNLLPYETSGPSYLRPALPLNIL